MDTEAITTYNCTICHINESKYNCPQCLRKTCSLNCFNRHKSQFECSGKSNITLKQTKYKPKSEIEGADVQRDYNFLNRVNRDLEVGKRDVKSTRILTSGSNKRQRNSNNGDGGPNKRRLINDDANFVIKRGVKLKQLPNGMSRRQSNRSTFDQKKKKFMWTLDWVLIDDQFATINKFTSFKNSEEAKLDDLVPVRRFTRFLEDGDTDEFKNLKEIVKNESIAEDEGSKETQHLGKNHHDEEEQTNTGKTIVVKEQDDLNPIPIISEQFTESKDITTTEVKETPNPITQTTKFKTDQNTEPTDSVTKHPPNFHKNLIAKLKVEFHYYLRTEDHRDKLIEIPPDMQLMTAIKDKLFIEYPIIYVSLYNSFERFKVVQFGNEQDLENNSSSSDSDSDSDSTSGASSDSDDDDDDDDDIDEAPEESSAKAPIVNEEAVSPIAGLDILKESEKSTATIPAVTEVSDLPITEIEVRKETTIKEDNESDDDYDPATLF